MLDKQSLTANQYYINTVKKFFNDNNINQLETHLKLTINGVFFNSNSIKTKRCDVCFVNEKEKVS
jgi:hypothetical protein